MVNVRVSDIFDLEVGDHGAFSPNLLHLSVSLFLTRCLLETLTLDLKKSNDNPAIFGNLMMHISTNVNQPISNPGPSQANLSSEMTTFAATEEQDQAHSVTGSSQPTNSSVSASAAAGSSVQGSTTKPHIVATVPRPV